MLTRRALLSRPTLAAACAAAGSLAMAGYATAFEPHRVQVRHYRLCPPRWPAGLRLRIAVLTDFHAHPRCMGVDAITEVVARTNALEPDLTVLLGDYGSQSRGAVPFETVAGCLSGLQAKRGLYAIQGNHDWGDDRVALWRGHGPTRSERALRAAGIVFLENAAVRLDVPTPLWLVGIESEATPGRPLAPDQLDRQRSEILAQVLRGVPADGAAILLAHEPDLFATGLDPRIVLTLSGHTHGGQVRILGWSPWIPSRYGLRYAHGHIVESERDLIVSAGLGSHFVAGRPLRLGIPPEIVVVDLGAPDRDDTRATLTVGSPA
ncbi:MULTISPECIES: metallophosphoesterase [unclassified Methylobacterium]|uniref:metallophosphoesterase n=1 Tax=unclassified Methylobacterium TaxID=2615210 RepID=UPI0011C1FE24|nr:MULTISPECIES: metallophosphoesterase [unclassified Methylobacterium]QEE42317.1 metallophosphoesterase [Methylobacterium sp. WL1]TXN53355.1 metallophosphoesterase [Methylobacterium sp. WL2]